LQRGFVELPVAWMLAVPVPTAQPAVASDRDDLVAARFTSLVLVHAKLVPTP